MHPVDLLRGHICSLLILCHGYVFDVLEYQAGGSMRRYTELYLVFDEGGGMGNVRVLPEFRMNPSIYKCDILKDWIYHLEAEYQRARTLGIGHDGETYLQGATKSEGCYGVTA